jgi:hypothetical protein
MAKFINGAIGTFSGKVGSIIGANWRDIHYMRGLPKKRTKPFTEAQLAQQQRFGLMGQFLMPLKGVLEIGLSNMDDSTATLFNRAMALNLPAVTGTYPDFTIDYASVQLSKGRLDPPRGVAAAAASGAVTVSWNPAANRLAGGNGDDDIYVLLYDREQGLFYTSDEIATRSAGQVEIPLDEDTAGHTGEVWLFAVSRYGQLISNTVYGGSHQLV